MALLMRRTHSACDRHGLLRQRWKGFRCLCTVLAIGLLVTGACLIGNHACMRVKACVAERLIARAFADHLDTGRPQRPWSWADMVPIARLEVPRLGIRRHVLTGGSGSSMAFGIGHMDGTAPPNGTGNAVLVGHRDSWFAFLKHVRVGDEIFVQDRRGRVAYAVTRICVLPERDTTILDRGAGSRSDPQLTLLTCYPFGGLRGSPWRYAVICERRRG